MLRKTSFWVSAILAVAVILAAYNIFFKHYSMSFLTVCGSGWGGIGRFLLWFLLLAGLIAIAVCLAGRASGQRCNCGCKLETDWCNCPNCGDELP